MREDGGVKRCLLSLRAVCSVRKADLFTRTVTVCVCVCVCVAVVFGRQEV